MKTRLRPAVHNGTCPFSGQPGRQAALEALTGRFALRRIGTIDDGAGVRLVRGGKRAPLPDAGFDHFEP